MKSKDFEIHTPFSGVSDPLLKKVLMYKSLYTVPFTISISGGGSLLNQVGLLYTKENISMAKN